MRGKTNKLFIAPLVAIILGLMVLPSAQAQSTLSIPNVIDTTLTPPNTFSVNVDVSNVIDLYGIEFKVAFDPNVVMAMGVSPGSFWVGGVMEWINTVDPSGFVWYSATRPMGTPDGITGSGTIAVIDFSVVGVGVSGLDLYDVLAGNRYAVPILLELYSGSFANEMNIVVALRTAYVGERHVFPPAPETLTARFMNLGTGRTTAKARFAIFDELGTPIDTLESAPVSLAPNEKALPSVSWSGYTVLTKYAVEVSVLYRDPSGGWTVGPKGDVGSARTTMTISFVVEA